MTQHIEPSKPYTLPDGAPDDTFIRVYWQLISKDPRWLTGLRRADGSLYLERQNKQQKTVTPQRKAG